MILPPVHLGVGPLQITLFDQVIDLVGGVGLGNVQKIRKLADRGLTQDLNDLQGEALHGGEGAVPLPYMLEHLAIELQLEFIIDLQKALFQHGRFSFPLWEARNAVPRISWVSVLVLIHYNPFFGICKCGKHKFFVPIFSCPICEFCQ